MKKYPYVKLSVEERMRWIDQKYNRDGYIKIEDALWLLRTLQASISGLSAVGKLKQITVSK